MNTRKGIKKYEAEFHDVRLLRGAAEDRGEQNKYYWATAPWEKRFWESIEQQACGKRVLEIGCFNGERTIRLASVAAEVYAIDISSAAVRITAAKAQSLGLTNVETILADAEALPFEDAKLDIAFCAGVIHHVNISKAVREIFRVLVPGGRAMFREPLGHNPFFNLYRKLTPDVRTIEEHPLTADDLRTISELFGRSRFDYFGMLSLLATPLRDTPFGAPARAALIYLDNLAFNNRVLGKYCWQVNIALSKQS